MCTHTQAAGNKSKCCREKYDAQNLISIVSFELRRQMELLEFLELKIREHSKKDSSYIDIETMRKQTKTEIEILNAEKIRQYEAYAEGIISREAYIRKKDETAEKIKSAEEKLQKAEQTMREQFEILSEMKQVTVEYERLCDENKTSKPITREMVLAMIDCIILHDTKTYEISFRFDDIGKRALQYIEEHGVALNENI